MQSPQGGGRYTSCRPWLRKTRRPRVRGSHLPTHRGALSLGQSLSCAASAGGSHHPGDPPLSLLLPSSRAQGWAPGPASPAAGAAAGWKGPGKGQHVAPAGSMWEPDVPGGWHGPPRSPRWAAPRGAVGDRAVASAGSVLGGGAVGLGRVPMGAEGHAPAVAALPAAHATSAGAHGDTHSRYLNLGVWLRELAAAPADGLFSRRLGGGHC